MTAGLTEKGEVTDIEQIITNVITIEKEEIEIFFCITFLFILIGNK